MPNKKDVSLTVLFSLESRKSSLTELEGGKSDESEIAHGVKAQLERSGAGAIKETDPYKGTGAIPKRPRLGNSRKPATSRSKHNLAEKDDESKGKNHDFSKDKILPYAVQGGPDNNFDLFCETHRKTNMNRCLGLVLGSDGL